MGFEERWKAGEIGSRECLEGQLRFVRIKRQPLSDYLSKIKIAPSFSKILSILKKYGIRPVIVSDNFSFMIRSILRNNGIKGIRVYSNEITFDNDKLIPTFPHTNKSCTICAHCKKNNMLRLNGRNKTTVYIGDGRSDICPAEEAGFVFAKGSLLEHFKKKKRSCVPFSDLDSLYHEIRRLER